MNTIKFFEYYIPNVVENEDDHNRIMSTARKFKEIETSVIQAQDYYPKHSDNLRNIISEIERIMLNLYKSVKHYNSLRCQGQIPEKSIESLLTLVEMEYKSVLISYNRLCLKSTIEVTA